MVNSISGFEELVICDTVPQQKKNKSEENRLINGGISNIYSFHVLTTNSNVTTRSNVVNVLSVAPLLAEAIFRYNGSHIQPTI